MLKGLSDFERQTIINGFKPEKKFSKGETIYAPSSFKRAIGYIVSGSATASTDNNNGVVMKTFSEGMCFGAAAVFGEGDVYVSKITANEDCSVLFISEAELKGIFETCPAAAVNYINFLSDKIRFLNKKLKIVSCVTARDSILKYLTEIANDSGVAYIPDNMSMLAKTLGIGRASLYRSLESLEKEGIIERNKNQIRVKNL